MLDTTFVSSIASKIAYMAVLRFMSVRLCFASALVFLSPFALVMSGCSAGVSPAVTTSSGGNLPAVTPPTPIGNGPQTGATQGVALNSNQVAYVSSSSGLAAYNADWTKKWGVSNALAGLPTTVNHMGDVAYYNGNLFAPVENYSFCPNFSSQILAVYDASTGALRTWSDISADAHEISSVTVIPEKSQLVVSSFCGSNNGYTTLWIYDLDALLNNAPGSKLTAIGTIKLSTSLRFIQGLSWNSDRGVFLVSADIGQAGSLFYISADGTVSGPAFVVTDPKTGELEGDDFTTGNAYYLEGGFVFNLGPPEPAPAFSLVAGTYSSTQTVTISDSDANAIIHYTIDGSIPTASSPVYSGPLSISSSQTLRAIATATGAVDSPLTTASYTIQ